MNNPNLHPDYQHGLLHALVQAQSNLYRLIDRTQHDDDLADRARQAQEENRQEVTGEHLRYGLRF